jgi:CRP-like cAMP-binding protein
MDEKLIDYYVEKLEIQSRFSGDLRPYMTLYQIERGEEVYELNQPVEMFYFLAMGTLKVSYALDNGKVVLLRFIKPPGVCGDVEIGINRPVRTTVSAATDCHLIGIQMSVIQKITAADPVFKDYIIESLSHKVMAVSNAMAINLSYPLENRFAGYLLSISSQVDDRRVQEIKTFDLREIATMLGTSYRHLCRVIKDFTDQGLISKRRSQILIEDYPGLEALSAGFYE